LNIWSRSGGGAIVTDAFEGNCKKTVEYEQHVFDYYGSVKNFFQQGEIADEAGRACIDSGDLDTPHRCPAWESSRSARSSSLRRRTSFDKGTNPEQAQFLPYLQGYVAFYAGDYRTSLEGLLKANGNTRTT